MAESTQNKSVGWVVGMVALTVLYFGWAFLAADYFQNGGGGSNEKTDFWVNSVAQLQNLPAVITYGLQHRAWGFVVVGVLEIGALILYGVLKKLEKELWAK